MDFTIEDFDAMATPPATGIRKIEGGWAAVRNGQEILRAEGTGSKRRAITVAGTNTLVECRLRRTITRAEIEEDSFPTSDFDSCFHCGAEIVEADFGARIWYHVA